MAINLLPHQTSVRTKADYLALAILVVVIFLATATTLVTLYWYQRQLTTESAINSLGVEKETAKKNMIDSVDTQQDLADVLDRQEAIAKLEMEAIDFTAILETLGAAAPIKLQIAGFSIKDRKDPIALAGISESRSDITLFTESLKKSGIFSGVTLGKANAQTEGVAFSVDLLLAEPAVNQTKPTKEDQ